MYLNFHKTCSARHGLLYRPTYLEFFLWEGTNKRNLAENSIYNIDKQAYRSQFKSTGERT